MGNNYVPLYIFLFCLIIIGALPLFISPFVNTSIPNPNSTIGFLATIFQNGTNITAPNPFCVINIVGLTSFPCTFTTRVNFFVIFLVTDIPVIHDLILSYLVSFSYVPDVIALPLVLIMIISLIYTVIKLFWGS